MKIGRIIICALFVGLSISSCLITTRAGATPLAPDWMNGDLIVKKSERSYSTSGCVDEVRQLKINPTFYYKAEDYAPKTWCIYHYKDFDITFYKRWFSSVLVDAMDPFGLYPHEESGMAISFDGGQLVPVENIGYSLGSGLVFTKGMSRVWYTGSCEFIGCELRMFDFNKEYFDKTQYSYNYTYRWSEQKLKYDDGSRVLGEGYALSSNGQWASTFIRDVGLARINTATLEAEIVHADATYMVPSYVSGLSPAITISNDGGLIIITGTVNEHMIIKYSDGCSLRLYKPVSDSSQLGRPTCQARSIASDLVKAITLTNGIVNLSHLSINNSNDHIWFFDNLFTWYDIYPSNSQANSMMDYLALGDSYSSGEGDIDQTGSTHYLSFTNSLGDYLSGIPRELCHVSDRSYPFLLANDMQIARGNDMQSIACSGAVRGDIFRANTVNNIDTSYAGQPALRFSYESNTSPAPRLQGLSDESQLRGQALTDFVPGRVQQIEMVRKYKPKVATVGISGNDVNFGPIIMECVTHIPTTDDCSYTKPEGLAQLGGVIKGVYAEQVKLYRALKDASPGTDFYAIGYPQFIRDDKMFCAEIADSLNASERSMIRHSVTALNEVIRNAAATAGVKYIDIENVITNSNQDMCGQSGMITGPLDKFYYGGLTAMYRDMQAIPTKENESAIEKFILSSAAGDRYSGLKAAVYGPMATLGLLMQEAFHPNAAGHEAIYQYIHSKQNGTSLLDDTCDGQVIICPDDKYAHEPIVGEYFGSNDKVEKFASLFTAKVGSSIDISGLAIVERGKPLDILLHESEYQPGSIATVELRSEPILLNAFTVEAGGSVSGSVTIPKDMSIGFHKLLLEGVTADGIKVEYIQPLYIAGPEDDVDGDGVSNDVDNCEFMTPSGIDTDRDGIDNNCDLSVHSVITAESLHTTPGIISGAISPVADHWSYGPYESRLDNDTGQPITDLAIADIGTISPFPVRQGIDTELAIVAASISGILLILISVVLSKKWTALNVGGKQHIK